MNSKPDKEDRRCDDIAFLSEIIDNFIFWQAICNFHFLNFGPDFNDITTFRWIGILSIYVVSRYILIIGFSPKLILQNGL
jgi:hypothetical protein